MTTDRFPQPADSGASCEPAEDATAAARLRTATPPPYPFPGWRGHPADNEPPEGYHWVWAEADDRWRLGGDGKRCRYTVGPNRKTCQRPAVATLNRAWSEKRTNRWGYCAEHLFSRHIHDGAIWEGRLAPAGGAS